MKTHGIDPMRELSSGQASQGSAGRGLFLPSDALLIIPVRNLVIFPGMILPLTLGRPQSIDAVQQALRLDRPVGVLLQKAVEVDVPGLGDLYSVGTVSNILRYLPLPDGSHVIVCQGTQRFRVLEYLSGYETPVARVLRIEAATRENDEVKARFIQVKERALQVLQLEPQISLEVLSAVKEIKAADTLADLVAGFLDIAPNEKQAVLEADDLICRLDLVLEYLIRRLRVLNLSKEINERTKVSMEEHQRNFLLREQLKSIQKELGEDNSDNSVELIELHKLVEAAGMPEEVSRQARKELKRLERMSDNSTEYSMIRAYLDWLIELPWKEPEPDRIEIGEARRILDADHFGLEAVKKRIVEFLAVRKLNPRGHGPILCFVGPPGVGKTSLGQSIAKSLVRAYFARGRSR